MTIASRIALTPGVVNDPAPKGMYYIAIREDGVLVRIDENKNETIIGRDGTQLISLNEMIDVDTINAVNGQYLIKENDKYLFKYPAQTLLGCFYASNSIYQSHFSQATLNILQDNVILKSGNIFNHNINENAHIIKMKFDGFIELSFKLVFLHNSKFSNITGKAFVLLNNEIYDSSVCYGISHSDLACNKMCLISNSIQIKVKKDDNISINSLLSRNNIFGDLLDINTIPHESNLTIKGYNISNEDNS